MFRDGENSRMMMNNGTSASASSINPNKSVCFLLLSHLSLFPCFTSYSFIFRFIIRKWLPTKLQKTKEIHYRKFGGVFCKKAKSIGTSRNFSNLNAVLIPRTRKNTIRMVDGQGYILDFKAQLFVNVGPSSPILLPRNYIYIFL